jgi:hypothetical protein
MHYQISRNGQLYGPYTLEDLQRYLASGNVLPTDLAKSEAMSDWVPVSQVLEDVAAGPSAAAPDLGFSGPSIASGGYAGPDLGTQVYNPVAQAQATLAASPYPDAPNLHWGLVLLFAFLTCTLFMFIWNLVISAWLKRVQPNAMALFFYAGAVAMVVVRMFVVGGTAMHSLTHSGMMYAGGVSGLGLGFLIWVLKLIARFSEMASLEEHFNGPEPVGLRLNGVMVFFFGGVYLQYKLNEINAIKQAARFGAVRPY